MDKLKRRKLYTNTDGFFLNGKLTTFRKHFFFIKIKDSCEPIKKSETAIFLN